ncbi:unnamed protein product [Leptidea sinapis]|uniref:Innexin n=1 Tax=Leptidea sinapis TaxID=189913 RepID=A0A5E4Q983_9NEOP|nr:unnamed protein product [Leptidea sinapis]
MAIFGMASAVAGFVKVRYLIDKAVIDNMVFRMHYRITSAIMFLCCILVTANNLIGDPISCISDGAIPNHVINTYCWITYTFTLPNTGLKGIAHPGLGNDYEEEKRIHSYYQWVPFMLFFQFSFTSPTGSGRTGRRARIDLCSTCLIPWQHILSGYIPGWSIYDVWNGCSEIEVFPRITKCTFHKFGASGTIQKHDALCVLALNILNEKIFIFLWFWLIILSIVSGLALVYSAAVILLPSTRETILKRRFRFGTPNGVEALVRRTQNMSLRVFGEVLDELARRLHFGSNPPSAPSTIEMAPMYPDVDKFSKETET